MNEAKAKQDALKRVYKEIDTFITEFDRNHWRYSSELIELMYETWDRARLEIEYPHDS